MQIGNRLPALHVQPQKARPAKPAQDKSKTQQQRPVLEGEFQARGEFRASKSQFQEAFDEAFRTHHGTKSERDAVFTYLQNASYQAPNSAKGDWVHVDLYV